MNSFQKKWLLIAALLISQHLAAQKLFPDDIYQLIENPEVFEINQQPGHASFIPCSTVSDALKYNQTLSKNILSLDGNWKFNWAENPQVAPQTFYQSEFDDRKWGWMKVPGNWEMEGYGDPMFRNVAQPFKANPPYVPREYNPTGSYRTTFTLPANWKGQKIFLHMEASTSATFVWLNGKELGYNQGANEPAEYDITQYVKPGKNLLAVRVMKYSDGTYLEDQDFWRLAGIFRSVYLISTPQIRLRDFFATTNLDEEYRDAELKIKADIMNYSNLMAEKYKIKATLLDFNQKPVADAILSDPVTVEAGKNKNIELSATVRNPEKWSAEYPNLYHLTLELIAPDGKTIQATAAKIGFKETEIRKQALWLNGVAIKLNGVNSHMQHPTLGHVMDRETIIQDFTLMKQFNINCVRTSHYPPTKEYLELADEMGIYIIDETGDESHATEFVSEKPEWRNAYVERVQKMVLRDRNHASVLFWSAGNESGFGQNICEVIAEGKRLDPTRNWMYGGNTDDVAWRNEVMCEEILGPRYPTPYQLETRIGQVPESQDPRPSFMDEYVAATGNGAGSLDEFWEVIYRYPRCIGGAVWDWVSPGISEKIRLIDDESPNKINTSIKGRAALAEGKFGKAIALNGHDQWIETYRHPALDIDGEQLTLSLWVYPRQWNGNGDFITKGFFQYGLVQRDEKTIEFYLTGNKTERLTAPLPANWENNWHHLAATLGNGSMKIYIDGNEVAEKPTHEKIKNKPFPVSIGYCVEFDGQEYPNYLSNATYDRVSIFNHPVTVSELLNPAETLKKSAALWLEMDKETVTGEYYSMGIGGRTYGMIWPDRSAQPELWQLKKSAQPIKIEMTDPQSRTIGLTNRFGFTNLNQYDLVWAVEANGASIESANMSVDLAPGKTTQITVPFATPAADALKEYTLLISFRLKNATQWAPKGFELAWEQFPLPVAASIPNRTLADGTLTANETDAEFTVAGKDFVYRFDKRLGELISIQYQGKELIESGPKLNLWRAPLANETDAWTIGGSFLTNRQPGMGNGASNNWFVAGLDRIKIVNDHFSSVQNNDGSVSVTIQNHADGADHWTGFSDDYNYTISTDGEMVIHHKITPHGFMPAWLPKIGTQWLLNKELTQVKWFGRGPFENYPDRKTGAKTAVYQTTVEQMVEPYLKPQDWGNRCDNRWVEIETTDGFGLHFSGDQLFHFSAHPYDTDHVTRAQYPYQMQKANHTVFNFDYATSGVGCTAISVLNEYRVLPDVYHFTTKVRPFKK